MSMTGRSRSGQVRKLFFCVGHRWHLLLSTKRPQRSHPNSWTAAAPRLGLPARSLTGAALDGPHGGGCAWRRGRPQRHALVVLGAALLDGPHVAVAAHAEAARHGQVQSLHSLRLQLAEHGLTHGFELPVHLHLAHLPADTRWSTPGWLQQLPPSIWKLHSP